MSYPLDRALADAIFGYANLPVTGPMELTVPPEALTELAPHPTDELMAELGLEYTTKVASWSEAL